MDHTIVIDFVGNSFEINEFFGYMAHQTWKAAHGIVTYGDSVKDAQNNVESIYISAHTYGNNDHLSLELRKPLFPLSKSFHSAVWSERCQAFHSLMVTIKIHLWIVTVLWVRVLYSPLQLSNSQVVSHLLRTVIIRKIMLEWSLAKTAAQ